MNKIGVSCGFFGKDWPIDFTASIRKASRLGFDAIELFTPGMMDQPKQKLSEYVALSAELGIELQYCTGLSPDCDLASCDESVRRHGIEQVKKTLDLIGFMHGKIFAGVNYIAWGSRLARLEDKPRFREKSLASIREVAKTAGDLGISYCVEPTNRFEQFLLNTISETNAFLRDAGSPSLKITFDTFHMSIEEDDLTDAILRAGANLGHVHLGEHNRHYPGKGFMPWDQIIRAFGKVQYAGTLGMEPFIIPGGDVGQGCAVWHDRTGGASEKELDEVARNAAIFIRNRVAMLIDSKVQSR
ncbi:MAG: sugar phosphate isomerase/epimerase [Spirochaetia bacterium]|jgi:D-psicose/D-tagatose/L-ribulose 3-epimerase